VLTGFLSEPELVEHYARCLAVYFAPYHEDYGFIVPEAFCSRKPVLTCTDTGGAAELVEDGLSGFVCAPDPFAVAEKLDLLSSRPGLAEDMGDKGHGRVSGLSWSGVVDEMITGKYHEEQTRST
jgi:glycosyltransferase involved in cell wall biosynthesis